MAAEVSAVGDRRLHSGGSGTGFTARDLSKKRGRLKLLAAAVLALAIIVILASLAASLPLVHRQTLRTYAVSEPPPMWGYDMVYDAQSDRIILFGGAVRDVGYRDETYSYDFESNTWMNMAPATAPSERWMHSMAYDSQSDRVVLCGGAWESGSGIIYSKFDTWAYDFEANSWTQMSPYEELGGFLAGFTYDSHSDRVVRFGGHDQWQGYNYTWTYDLEADDWSDMNPAQAPDELCNEMVYDSESDAVVMFGLLSYPGPWMAMTWAYDLDQNTWTNMNPAQHPPKMWNPAMAYDSESDRVILFGGCDDATQVSSDQTWAYNLNTNVWTNMNPATKPSGRYMHAMAYDSDSDRVILFGGYVSGTGNNETWAYDFNTNTWTLLPPGQIIPEFGAVGMVTVMIATVCMLVALRRLHTLSKTQ